MKLDKIVRAGDEVRVKNEKGGFSTVLDAITGKDSFTVMGSLKAERQALQRVGEKYLVSCVTEQGLYIFDTEVIDVRREQNIALVELRVLSNFRKIQRREAFRVTEKLDVYVRLRAEPGQEPARWTATYILDISETGILLRFNERCEPKQPMEFIVRIDHFGIKQTLPILTGRVVRCNQMVEGQLGYLIGVQFEDMPDQVRNLIIKLVVLSQRSKLTYRRAKRYN